MREMKKIFAGAMAAGILWCSCTASVSALPQKQSSMRDITTAQLYYRAAKGDSNWSAASRCDFNDDNVIDVADFVEIWLHYTVRG